MMKVWKLIRKAWSRISGTVVPKGTGSTWTVLIIVLALFAVVAWWSSNHARSKVQLAAIANPDIGESTSSATATLTRKRRVMFVPIADAMRTVNGLEDRIQALSDERDRLGILAQANGAMPAATVAVARTPCDMAGAYAVVYDLEDQLVIARDQADKWHMTPTLATPCDKPTFLEKIRNYGFAGALGMGVAAVAF